MRYDYELYGIDFSIGNGKDVHIFNKWDPTVFPEMK